MGSWRGATYRAIRPALFAMDAEAVHHLTLSVLGLAGRSAPGRSLCAFAAGQARADPVELMGLRFRNRVGVGAGFDKDGVAIRGWEALGLGHVELGTVTPRPQSGNPRPRLVRLTRDGALVNRMGFNNGGADALARRVARARRFLPEGFVVGVSIGRNRDTPEGDTVGDYVRAARAARPVADYIAINVSSPNTPGLRALGRAGQLEGLLHAVVEAAGERPVVVKLSPDMEDSELDALVEAIARSGAQGVVLSNTTTSRSALSGPGAPLEGGLSGRPLLPRTLAAVAVARRRAGPGLAIIASGGIASALDAERAVQAGADLVQLWTGLVYGGPGLIGDCVRRTAC